MDTPDKIANSSPFSSNFEDSPIFNYISNLSPIKPFKSNTAHSFQSISFAPVPSVFTSPQACSLTEAKCFKSGEFSKALAVEETSEAKNDSPAGLSEIVELPNCSADVLGTCHTGPSMSEAFMEKTDVNNSIFLPKLPESFEHEYNSPDKISGCSLKPGLGTEIFDTPVTDACFHNDGILQVDKEAGSDSNLCGRFSIGLAKDESSVCDWDKFISDHSDLFMFDSSNCAEVSRVHDHNFDENSSASFATKFQIENVSYQQVVGETSSSHGLSLQNTAFYGGRFGQLDGANCRPFVLPCSQNVTYNANIEHDQSLNRLEVTDVDSAQSNSKVHNQQLRIMRRRCLVFDAVGVFTKSMENGLKINAATTYQSDGTLDDKSLVPYKHAVSTSPCMVPGIGLHLNTLATSKNSKVCKQEILSSGKHILSMPRSVTSVSPLTTVQKPITKRLMLSPADNGFIPCDEINVMEDNGQPTELGVEEESFRSSPTKKKRKIELEDEGCKKCNCKKSKCLKLYCECFAAGVYCVEPCSCIDCYNKPVHEDTVLSTRRQIESRNPMAFAPKVVWKSDAHLEMALESADKTPASARHKRGCNCKKSNCNKKYCECFQGGVGCSNSCRCEGCKNAFGAKDGIILATIDEAEAAEDALPGLIKNELDTKLPLMAMQKDRMLLTDTHMAITPLSSCRTLLKLPSSARKPPRSVQSAGSAKKNGSKTSKTKLVDSFPNNLDGETPEFLKGSVSPCSGVKKLSPNSKRVSPLNHNDTSRMSPGMRSSRRLILQSIPSCPPQ